MFWLALLVLIDAHLAQTRTDSPLNNLAALESVENILKTIDDLTISAAPVSTIETATQAVSTIETITQAVSTIQTVTQTASERLAPASEIATNGVLENKRRAGGGDAQLISDIYNDRNVIEMQRHIQSLAENPAVYSALNRQVITYGVPRLPPYLNNVHPPRKELAEQLNDAFNPPTQQEMPLHFTKPLQDAIPEYENFDQNFHTGNLVNVINGKTMLEFFEVTPPAQSIQTVRPAQNLHGQSTPIPIWMLQALQELQGRRPMDSPTIIPQKVKRASYPLDASLTTRSSPIDTAFREVNAKAISKLEWQRLRASLPILYSASKPPSYLSTRILSPPIVSPPPPTMSSKSAKKIRSKYGRLQANSLVPKNDLRTFPHVTEFHPPSTAWTVSKLQSRMAPRLPATSPKRYRLVSSKNKPPAENLFKLTKFMRDNREMLLQFMAMKRDLLLGEGKREHGNGNKTLEKKLRNTITAGKNDPDWVPRNIDGASGVAVGEKRPLTGHKVFRFKASEHLEATPVVRVLPDEYDERRLDLAPAKGHKVVGMRFKDRICQRNVMVVAGPKYDSKSRILHREFRPGVDRRYFEVTRRKKLLLPACCNCCKKSVLGCE